MTLFTKNLQPFVLGFPLSFGIDDAIMGFYQVLVVDAENRFCRVFLINNYRRQPIDDAPPIPHFVKTSTYGHRRFPQNSVDKNLWLTFLSGSICTGGQCITALCLSLITGCQDRVQSGNPLYAAELYRWPSQGQRRPIWTQFFAKITFRICAGATKKIRGPFHIFLAPKWAIFGGHHRFVENVGRALKMWAEQHL